MCTSVKSKRKKKQWSGGDFITLQGLCSSKKKKSLLEERLSLQLLLLLLLLVIVSSGAHLMKFIADCKFCRLP